MGVLNVGTEQMCSKYRWDGMGWDTVKLRNGRNIINMGWKGGRGQCRDEKVYHVHNGMGVIKPQDLEWCEGRGQN